MRRNPVDIEWITYKSTQMLNPNNQKTLNELIAYYNNQKSGVPDDFDWLAYRSLNPDLSHLSSYKDCVKHYKNHGQRQNREYKFPLSSLVPDRTPQSLDLLVLDKDLKDSLPPDFDWLAYRSLNPDLSHYNNLKDCARHWRDHGQRQNRPYKYNQELTQPTRPLITAHRPILEDVPGFTQTTQKYMNENNNMPEDFSWQAYKTLNPDLHQIKSYTDAVAHYQNHGRRENRCYRVTPSTEPSVIYPQSNLNPAPEGFDWMSYRSLNSDLKHLKNHAEALRHYQEHGQYQNRLYRLPVEPDPNQNYAPVKVDSGHDSIAYEPYKSSNPSPDLLTGKYKIPPDFQWQAYRSLNPDLKYIQSLKEAAKHYTEHGYRQNRPYNYKTSSTKVIPLVPATPIYDTSNIIKPVPTSILPSDMPNDFDWRQYRQLNPDLSHLKSLPECIAHYTDHGRRENRPYKSTTPLKPKSTPVSRMSMILPIVPPIKSKIRVPTRTEISDKSSTTLVPVTPIPKMIPRVSGLKLHVEPYIKSSQPIVLPPGFNWVDYKDLNPDLKHLMDSKQAEQHYMEHGYRECRQYRRHDQPAIEHSIAPRLQSFTNHPSVVHLGHQSSTPIPNIIHFIYGFKEQKVEFELFKYLAIKSAVDINHPDRVLFHYKYEPFGPWWDQVKPMLELIKVNPPTEVFGNRISSYAHQSDVIRLQVLNDMGGVYLDIDTICLRPFKDFMNHDFVMGLQGTASYGLCNAIMMSKPGTAFGLNWYQSYRNFNTNDWDYHSVQLPLKLSKVHPVTILADDLWFYPLWDPMPQILFQDQVDLNQAKRIFSRSYCIHLWESICEPQLRTITPQSIMEYNSLYNMIARKYIKNTISIVMLTFNRSQKTIECIQSFLSSLDRNDIQEFLILDNHSHESELLDYLRQLPQKHSKCRVIFKNENLGVCGGRIILFEEARGDLICSVDSDLSLQDPKFFDICKEHLNNESIGMVGASGANFCPSFKFQSHKDFLEGSFNHNLYVDQLAGCCQVFRRDLKYLGVKLDPNYGKFWVEDADFCFQITNLGKKLLLIPQKGLVNHSWGGSGGGMNDLFLKNWAYFTRKWINHKHLCTLPLNK